MVFNQGKIGGHKSVEPINKALHGMCAFFVRRVNDCLVVFLDDMVLNGLLDKSEHVRVLFAVAPM